MRDNKQFVSSGAVIGFSSQHPKCHRKEGTMDLLRMRVHVVFE